jgi:hypothetical protein
MSPFAAIPTRAITSVVAAGTLLLSAAPASAQATWAQIPSPNAPGSNLLYGAAASGASNVWTVGQVVDYSASPPTWNSLALRFNGSAWAPVRPPDLPGSDSLAGVDTTADTDVWAVGSRETGVNTHFFRTLIIHWDGIRWATVPSPNPNPAGNNGLASVRVVPGGSGAAWAVGSYSDPLSSIDHRALIVRRSGGTWTAVAAPRVTSSDFLEAVDASGASDAWAVGWAGEGPYGAPSAAITVRWNGSSWRAVPVPVTGPAVLYGVVALSPTDAWAVGYAYPGGPHWIPLVLHFNGVSWTRASIPLPPASGQLHDVVALSPTNVYAVGYADSATPAETYVLHWDGRTWTRERTPSPAASPQLTGAAAVGPETIWATGQRVDQTSYDYRTLTVRTTNG